MDALPAKLVKHLKTLSPEDRATKELLFTQTYAKALEAGLQSPRFWAMRQVIAGLDAGQIQHKINTRTHAKDDSSRDLRAP